MKYIGRYAVTVLLFILVKFSLPAVATAAVFLDEEEVVFRLNASQAEEVYLVGDFNSWNPTMDIMVKRDGYHEIRLFLLPGRYRYAFLVDGKMIPDPDNEHLDKLGYSFFIVAGEDGNYDIIYGKPGESVQKVLEGKIGYSGGLILNTCEDQVDLFGRFDFTGRVGDRLSANVSTGGDYGTEQWGEGSGSAFLLGGEATYNLKRGVLRAFSRREGMNAGDPLDLFGSVGPYGYPLGLFYSGIEYSGRVALGVTSHIFYAGRLEGYRSGLENINYDYSCTPHCARDLTDSDIEGAKVTIKTNSALGRFLFRQDKRKHGNPWKIDRMDELIFRGFEKTQIFGGWFTFPYNGKLSMDVEILRGRCFLIANEKLDSASEGYSDFQEYDLDVLWEEGYRTYTGVNFKSGKIGVDISLTTTSLTGDGDMREGRTDGRSTALKGKASFDNGDLNFVFSSLLQSFSVDNTGDIFWSQRMNFWLDGDDLSINRLPFLKSRSIYNLNIGILRPGKEERRPFQEKGLKLSLSQTGDLGGGQYLRQVIARGGHNLYGTFSLLADIRCAHYHLCQWFGENYFVDAFISVLSEIGDNGWVSLGLGVNPYSFDIWRYSYTGFGREKYLFDHKVMDAVGSGETGRIMEAISSAEDDLSRELYIGFEAGFNF
jgi:hypothetical protein